MAYILKQIRITIILIVCMHTSHCKGVDVDDPAYSERITNRMTKRTAIQLEERFGLKPAGFGGSAITVITELSLSMNLYNAIDGPAARRLAVDCAEIFLKNINSAKEVRPYFIEYPFPLSRIDFSMCILNEAGSFRTDNSLASMWIVKGRITYNIFDKKTGRLLTIRRENYEEAKKIVMKERNASSNVGKS